MLAAILAFSLAQPQTPYFEAPSDKEFAKVVPGGTTILPNGRFLTPAGDRLYTGEDLWQVLASPNGRTVVGFRENGLTVYETDREKRDIAIADVAPCGAFAANGDLLVVSTGDRNGIEVWETTTWTKYRAYSNDRKDGYIHDIAVSKDERWIYGLDIANQEVVVFDNESGSVATRVKAGRQPYALALSEDGKDLFVANIGIFDYSVVPAPAAGQGDPRGLYKPPFGFPSEQAENGVTREGRNIPGLGSPYVPDAQSIWKYSLASPDKPAVVAKAKSGLLIHALSGGGENKAVGGSAPNELLLRKGRLWVSNANNDTVQEFDSATMKPIRTIRLNPVPALAKYRGAIPSGMAMSNDGTTLYVCESGLNSIAVIDVKSGNVKGRIPSGWFPMQLGLSPDGRTLYVAAQKGIGRGPRGALSKRPAGDERAGLPDMPGMIQRVALPYDFKAGNQAVLRNNGLVPKPAPKTPKVFPIQPGKGSDQIKYVVFITKENHTFDGIFGGLKGAKGEPEYAEFGMNGWIKEKGKAERLPIMPNHIRLAEQFSISENFYMEPQASGDGHRWLVGVYPSLWTTRVFYAGWDFRPTNDAKGRLVSMGSNGSQIPEDYLENGSLWEHLNRGKIPFRNYGEGYELPGTDEPYPVDRSGTLFKVNHPMPKVLFDNTDFNFPAYNNNIPDIARADWFKEDIAKYRKSNGGKLPRFINIAICNDHGDSPRPNLGYPYVCSYMADNDLALGRIVEYLSNTPEWKNMAIFVTQDDSGADDDHIDRHRSYVLAISPWAKRGHITRDHTSIMSIIRSIYLLFGLGPNNMFDAVATPLHDMFTDKPNFAPYKHVDVDPRVFKPEDTLDPTDPKFERRRRMKSVKMDDPAFFEWLRRRGGR
jgi:DNA-binding beta-propeller fold protein YncE